VDSWEIARRMTLLDRLTTAQKHPKQDAQAGISELKKERLNSVENNPKNHPKQDALITHPKQDASTMLETPKNGLKSRTSGTPDTDIKGRNSRRYKWVKNRILNRTVNPSINALSQLKFGGVKMGKETAQKYLEAMLEEGMVEQHQLSNGRMSYRLKMS
jgi:hypothetical protein